MNRLGLHVSFPLHGIIHLCDLRFDCKGSPCRIRPMSHISHIIKEQNVFHISLKNVQLFQFS